MIKRIFAIIFGIIIGAAVICGIWYSAAPREFLQTVLPDKAYVGFTLTQNGARGAKNLAKFAKAKEAYTYKADMDINVDKTAVLNSKDAADALSDYLDKFYADGKICFQKSGFKATFNLSDGQSSLLSGAGIMSGKRQLFKLDQIGEQWFERSNKTLNFDKLSSLKQLGTLGKFRNVEFSDATQVSITDGEETITVGEVSASGEVVTIIAPTEEFRKLLVSLVASLGDETTDVQATTEKVSAFLEKNNIKEIVVNLHVDKRNHIVGVSLGFTDESGKNPVDAMGAKSAEADGKYALEYDTDKVFFNTLLTFEKAPYEDYAVPETTEVIPLDTETLKNELQEYIFGNLVKGNPQLEKVYKELFSKFVGDKVNDVISALTGGGNGSSFGNFDEAIGDILSLFGIGG